MDGDYLSLVVNAAFQTQTITSLLSLLFLTFARLFPIILLVPFFGSKVLPHPVKVAFGFSLFVIFLPMLVQVTTTPLGFNVWLIFLLVKEFLIGYIIGFLMSIPFFIVQNAGMFIDHQRGGASLMINDPAVQNQSSPLGTLFNFVLIFIFFMIDGPFLFIDAIIKSYEIIPPDRILNPLFFSEDSPFWHMQFQLYNKLMVLSVQLASPGLITILMTDVFLGIINRLAPQIQITFLGLPLKSLLALAVITVGWKVFTDQMAEESLSFLVSVKEFIHFLGIGQPT